MENKIKVQNARLGADLQISVPNSDYAVSVTNNRAQYYSEQAKRYRDEAKTSRDEAKYYAEQNSNVTYEYIETVKNSLEQQINTKQIQGNYALASDIPQKVSELENDSNYVQTSGFSSVADEYLSNLTDTAKTVLKENGAFWGHVQGDISTQTDLGNLLDERLNLSASNLNDTGKKSLSALSMPSDRYIDLDLGASGANYVAPANGYYQIAKGAKASGQYVLIGHTIDGFGLNGIRDWSSGTSQALTALLPCKKGDTVTVVYTTTGDTYWFRFVYAEGN